MSVYTLADIIAKPPFGTDPDPVGAAVIFAGVPTTYGRLEDRAERLAAGLAAAGFGHGDRVCVLMHNRTEWLEIFFAVARLGGVLVPLNHLLTTHEALYIVEDSGATWLVAQDELWNLAEGLHEISTRELRFVAVGTEQAHAIPYEELFASERLPSASSVGIDDVVLLQYTSGTTGFPKGAIHTHSTVMWNAISQKPHFSVDRSSVYLCLPALSWVAGFHSLHLQTLWSGGTVVLHPSNAPFDAQRFCELIERHRVTSVALVPTVIRRLLALPDLEERNLSSLQIAITGGESVPVHLIEEMHERLPAVSLIQVYGMSEFPSLVTLLEPRDALSKLGSAGRANCVSQVRVVDEADQDRAAGEVGEILTRSPATMVGYHGLPEATASVLKNGWLHTGDLGYLDEDGYLFISGRSKDLIISGGLNIYPAEVEQALLRHDAIAEVAVIAQADDKWGEVAKAIVVVADDVAVTEDELRTFLEPYVARFKIPKLWEIRTEPPLPRTASGKVQKFLLQQGESS
jgi:fatty-acyl-CoA synthase